MHIVISSAIEGKWVRTKSGSWRRVVAFIPDAAPSSKLVVVNPLDGDVDTYWADGSYHYDRSPCNLDLDLSSVFTIHEGEKACA